MHFVLMDNATSHCFVDFANTIRLKVKKGSNTLVLGNDDQVPTEEQIDDKIEQYQSQITSYKYKWLEVG